MLKPEGRMSAFMSTGLPIWARQDRLFTFDTGVGAEQIPWVINMANHNGVTIEDFVSDAAYSGSFMLAAVSMGMRVGRTHGRDWPGDLTPILSGPVTDVLAATPVPVTMPNGPYESLSLTGYSPTAAAYYGMTVMRAAMNRPIPGAELVIAAVGDPDAGRPHMIHRNESIPVPYMNPHGYEHF